MSRSSGGTSPARKSKKRRGRDRTTSRMTSYQHDGVIASNRTEDVVKSRVVDGRGEVLRGCLRGLGELWRKGGGFAAWTSGGSMLVCSMGSATRGAAWRTHGGG